MRRDRYLEERISIHYEPYCVDAQTKDLKPVREEDKNLVKQDHLFVCFEIDSWLDTVNIKQCPMPWRKMMNSWKFDQSQSGRSSVSGFMRILKKCPKKTKFLFKKTSSIKLSVQILFAFRWFLPIVSYRSLVIYIYLADAFNQKWLAGNSR